METPIYIVLSRQTGLERQMDMIANNLANMNTPGFKHQRMQFNTFLSRTEAEERLSLVQDRAAVRDLSNGPMSRTGNQLDVALQGKGYFAVDTRDGQRFTRGGRFQLDSSRQITDVNGLPVLDDRDRPITVPATANAITITADGTVSTETGPLGKLKLASFQREQDMEALGGGLYRTSETPQTATDTKIVQGMIEEANVQPIVEMTQMTELMRQYQNNQRLIESEHERQRNAIGKLAKTTG